MPQPSSGPCLALRMKVTFVCDNRARFPARAVTRVGIARRWGVSSPSFRWASPVGRVTPAILTNPLTKFSIKVFSCPCRGQHAFTYIAMETRIRPLCHALHIAMFHRVPQASITNGSVCRTRSMPARSADRTSGSIKNGWCRYVFNVKKQGAQPSVARR